MTYMEMQHQFYLTFPQLIGKLFLGLVILIILSNLLRNKSFVRIVCRFIMLIPILIVALVLHVTKY